MLKMGAQELEDMETNWWGVEMKGFGVFTGGSWQKSFQASGWGVGLLKEEELAWDLACPVSGSSALFWSLLLLSPASPPITLGESARESTECFLELGNVCPRWGWVDFSQVSLG